MVLITIDESYRDVVIVGTPGKCEYDLESLLLDLSEGFEPFPAPIFAGTPELFQPEPARELHLVTLPPSRNIFVYGVYMTSRRTRVGMNDSSVCEQT